MMILFPRSLAAMALVLPVLFMTPSSASAQHAAPKLKINPPPSADLAYSIKARQSGLEIGGNAVLQWNVSGGKYSIVAETRAMLVGKILDERSEGSIDEHGLAPATFTEKRFRRNQSTATFDRKARMIRFTESAQTYPIKGGEQDRASALWQLISIARAAPSKFKTGTSWTFFVAGQEDGDSWTFKIGKPEKIRTAIGEVTALHVLKSDVPESNGRRVDIWLAPSHEWYPVKIRFTESGGEYIEQTLDRISRK